MFNFISFSLFYANQLLIRFKTFVIIIFQIFISMIFNFIRERY